MPLFGQSKCTTLAPCNLIQASFRMAKYHAITEADDDIIRFSTPCERSHAVFSKYLWSSLTKQATIALKNSLHGNKNKLIPNLHFLYCQLVQRV